eukprot:TRINITY_DN65873_c6_g2_i1.p1 TRINITY_DN65873_c6_g2~~TRINITY_DN65873_c6_g2_i1.p1  ORF type:complete len:755 (+),score=446.50 TRINITY_DN65873_c6_g2_i1:140-2404(+)
MERLPALDVGTDVVVGRKRGVIKYVGPLKGTKGTWYGVLLTHGEASGDGCFRGQRYFQAPPRKGMFTRRRCISAYTPEAVAAIKIQATWRGVKSRADVYRQAVRDGDEAKLAELNNAPHFKNMAAVTRAAVAIQRVFRGMKGRSEAKGIRLWKVWNVLDQKDESEQVHQHQSYEQLKEVFLKGRNEHGALERKKMPAIHGEKPTEMDEDDCPILPKGDITLDFVTAMMDHFKHNRILRKEDVMLIAKRAIPLLKALPNVVPTPIHTKITVVGDLHGQLDDLFTLFKLNGLPSLRNAYLFNGDFVDRGQYSLECVLTLLCFKLLYPEAVFLNRGNHEARDINTRDGFERECCMKYDLDVFDVFSELFKYLPLAHIIDDKIFVVHGGLFWDDLTLDDLFKENRFHEIPPNDSYLEQCLWSDPRLKEGRDHNPRGASLVFGPDVVDRFLAQNKLSMIIRSHECQQEGFCEMFDGKLITVFSASNYCGVVGNKGAFIIFEKNDLTPKIVQFEAKPKERMARYRMRHAMIETDVISKLLRRIAENRLALADLYHKYDADRDGAITRAQWADGLREVLGLNIPFLEFQSYLGLPKLGVKGTDKGDVDYMEFLNRYKIDLTWIKKESTASNSSAKIDVEAVLERMASMLFRKRYELEALFRYFDANGDGVISVAELTDGIKSLGHLLDEPLNDAEIAAVSKYLDVNGDGMVDFDEFFGGFRLSDPQLKKIQEKADEIQKSRKLNVNVNNGGNNHSSKSSSN